jgi:S-adenosylmethionine:diacylglycerol 3-amino-3-carboxypropyl transferase
MAEASSTSSEALRQSGAAHLRWVLEQSGEFPDLPGLNQMSSDRVVSLGGGVDAATYLVRCPDRDVVVKLNSRDVEAEARALRAWRRHTPRVPELLGSARCHRPENAPCL